MSNRANTSLPNDLNPTEAEFYERFRDAYEAYGQWSWEAERTKEAHTQLADELVNIQALVQEMAEKLGNAKTFSDDTVGPDGLANTIQRRIEQDVLKNFDTNFPHTLKTALLNEFLKREKESRASVYKKHVRRGLQSSTEALIQEERQKNEAWREIMLARCREIFPPEDIELIRTAFHRRMARHGMQEKA